MSWPSGNRVEAGYHFLIDNYPHAVCYLSPEGQYLELNKSACALAGLKREQLLGRDYCRDVLETDRDKVERALSSALNRQIHTIRYALISSSGNQLDVESTFLPLISNAGVEGVYCISENITARIEERRVLTDGAQGYRALFDRNPDPTFYLDPDGNIADVNHAALEMAGVAREDLLGLNIAALAPEKEQASLAERFARIKQGESLQYALNSVNFDGSSSVLAVTAIPVFIDDRFIGVHNVVQDISARVQAELALQEKSAALAERVKELYCIKQLGEILECRSVPDEALLREIVNILPAGWQYPELTAARIVIGDIEVKTENYRKPRWRLTQPVWIQDEQRGLIEVIYRKKMPERDEGPFLKEERDLLNIVADKLQRFYEQYLTAEQLHLSAKALDSTAEGVMVLDTDGKVAMINPAYTRLTGYRADELVGVALRHTPGDKSMSVKDWFGVVEKQGPSLSGESWFQRKDGAQVAVLASISAIRDAAGATTHYVVALRDISEQKHVQERLDYLWYHDALTSLPNRTFLAERGPESLLRARRQGGFMAVCFLDIDRFKHVNDSLGHEAGDELLTKVGKRLHDILRGTDTVARLGGDEFGILLSDLTAASDASAAAAKIIKAFREPFEIDARGVMVTASLGVAIFPTDSHDFNTLLHNAELAMYSAKEQGRVNYMLYSRDMQVLGSGVRVLTLRTAMHQALERDEFRLHYQPIVNLASGRVTGMEALIRWHSEELGVVPPSDFIPLAEEAGLIYRIGEWVLREAVREMAGLVRAGYDQLRMAVNLSARQFQQANLVQQIRECLESEGLAARHLELEITETMMMYGVERTVEILRDLHALGVSIALDDFGTGYSSLQYLKDFPIEYLKIDKSFVDGLPMGARDCAITQAIIGVARGLKIKVIAEGVEKDEQLAYLRDIGCQEAQGYLLSMPLPAEELRRLLDSNATLPVLDGGRENEA